MALSDFIAELDAEEQERQQQSPAQALDVAGAQAGGSPSEPAMTSPAPDAARAGEPAERADGGAPTQEQPESGIGGKIAGALVGLFRSPFQAAGASLDFAGDMVRSTDSPLGTIATQASGQAGMGALLAAGYAFEGKAADFSSMRSTVGQMGDATWNQVSSEILSLVVGGGLAGAATKLAGGTARIAAIPSPALRRLATTGAWGVEGGAVTGALINPEAERLSNLLESMGLETAFTDYLAHTDDETRAEGRWKNSVEGAIGGAAAAQLFMVGKYWYKAWRGQPQAADEVAEELSAGMPRVEESTGGQIDEVLPGEAPPPSRPSQGDAQSGPMDYTQDPDGTLRVTVTDDSGEAAIAQSDETKGGGNAPQGQRGAPASGPEGGAPDPVGDGAGGAGSSAPEEAPIIFRFTPETGEPRIVGSISREDLSAIGEDVVKWRAIADDPQFEGRGVDVTREIAPETASRAGEFRIGVLGSADNVAPFIRALVDRLPAQARRADTDLMAITQATVRDIGEDSHAVLEAARLISGKLTDADVAMATLRSLWVRGAKDIDELNLPSTDWENLSEEAFRDAATRVHNMITLSTHVQTAKQALGRGLRVNQLPDADTYLKALGKEGSPLPPRTAAPLPRTRAELKDWMDLWTAAGSSPEARAKLLENLIAVPTAGRYLRTSFANLFTANILSAPRTVLLNIVGPAFISTVRTVERMSGAAVGAINPFATAAERASMRAVARSTVPAYFQTLEDIGQVFRMGIEAGRRNHSIIGGGGTFDALSSFGPLTDNLIAAAGGKPDWRYSLGNLINRWPSAVVRVNNGMDEFSKRLAYQGEIRVRAMVEASERGLNPEDARALIAERMAGAYDEVGHAADQELLRAAERTTLTAQVGEEGTHLRAFGNGLQRLRRDVPELRFLIPVFNVPANALGETLRRLPIAHLPGFGGLFPRTARELAGEFGPVAQAEAHGRFLTGTAFMTAGILLNRAGLLTGSGPRDRIDRRVWLQTHQPYSIRMGDTWVRYDRFDILGGLLSIPATAADATTNRRMDKGAGDLISSGAGALAQWFRDRAALQNAAGLLGAGANPMADTGTFLNAFIGRAISGLLVPNLVQTVGTQTLDPVQRMRRGWDDYLLSAIPGLSDELEPVRNVLGEPMNRPADTFGEALFPVVMAPATSFQEDPILDEIDRLYQATGYAAGADPTSLGHGFFDPKDVKGEDGLSLYGHFMRARQVMKVNGYTLRETLQQLFESGEYANAVDADPLQQRTSLGDLSRGYMVRQAFDRFNEAIKAELAATSPTARSYLTAAAAKQRDDAYLRDVSAEDLATNPDLYRTRGIDPDAYSSRLQEGSTGALLEALQGD